MGQQRAAEIIVARQGSLGRNQHNRRNPPGLRAIGRWVCLVRCGAIAAAVSVGGIPITVTGAGDNFVVQEDTGRSGNPETQRERAAQPDADANSEQNRGQTTRPNTTDLNTPLPNTAEVSARGDSVRSVQVERLGLRLGTSLRVVRAGEKMPWVFDIDPRDLVPDGFAASGDSLSLRYAVYRVDWGRKVASGRREWNANNATLTQTLSIDDPAPKTDGVYEVRFEWVRRSEKLWARLRPKDVVLEKLSLPMLVLAPEGEVHFTASPWQTIGLIQPSEPAIPLDTAITRSTAKVLGQWIPETASELTELLPGVRKGSSVLRGKNDIKKGEVNGLSVSILSPGKVFQAALPIMTTGYPHRITVRCPRSQIKGLRLELGQPDNGSSARFSALIDDGHSMLDLQAVKDGQGDNRWLRRTFQFYPESGDQLRLINQNDDADVAFDSIQITAGPSTVQGLIPRRDSRGQSVDNQRLRQVVMMVRDPNWADSLTADWRADDDADPISPDCVQLHRVWLAAHRIIEQAQLMGARSVAIPWTPKQSANPGQPTIPADRSPAKTALTQTALTQTTLTQTVSVLSDRQHVELHAFERFNTFLKAAVPVSIDQPDQPDRLTRCTHDLSRFRCFDGYVVNLIGPSPGSNDDSARYFLDSLVRCASGKPLLIQTDTKEAFKSLSDIASHYTGVTLVTADNQWHDPAAGRDPSARTPTTAARSPKPNPSVMTKGVLVAKQVLHPRRPADAILETIDRHHPSLLIVDDQAVRGLVDDDFLRTCTAFQSLSIDAATIATADPTSAICRVEHSLVDGRAVLSLVNLAPWPVMFTLDTSGKPETFTGDIAAKANGVIWERIDDDSMKQTHAADLEKGMILSPRDTVLLRTRFPVPEGWTEVPQHWRWRSAMVGGDALAARIKKDVTTIVERIGVLSDPVANDSLQNGSFEQVGEMGLIGWLHAQHPPGCVAVDSSQSTDGQKSIRLITDESVSARTWLVSETIPVPTTRRLAVSMALRGSSLPTQENSAADGRSANHHPSKHAKPNRMHRLRISVEGIQAGHPIRKSAEVDVPASGIWQPQRVVLETDGLDASAMQSIRLTVDSLTAGTVWIDDVRLHNDFSTARERTDLQNLAFLAVEGLKRGNLSPSAKLLMNPWAQRLLQTANPPTLPPKDSAVHWGQEATEEASAEVAEKNRGWLLDRLRF